MTLPILSGGQRSPPPPPPLWALVGIGLALPLVSGIGNVHPHPGARVFFNEQDAEAPSQARWRVEPSPEVSIGTVEGPEEYVLVNVIDATVLRDGTVVLALFHGNFFRLRYFDESGTFVTSAGRWGEGPFEFTRGFLSLDALPGDSLMIISDGYRYSIFGPRGEGVRSGRLSLPTGSMPLGLVDRHHVALQDPRTRRSATPGLTRYGWSFSVFDIATETVAPVGVLPDTRGALGERGVLLRLPFEPQPYWSASHGRLWFGHSGRARIEGYDPSDGSRLNIQLDRPPRAVTAQTERQWKEFDLARAPNEELRRAFEGHHRGLDFPETFPRFQGIEVDGSGNVWVLRYEPPWSEAAYVWDVFDPQGDRLATATAPFEVLGSRLRTSRSFLGPLLEIGDDYMLVKDTGPFDVVQVSKHRLVKELPAR